MVIASGLGLVVGLLAVNFIAYLYLYSLVDCSKHVLSIETILHDTIYLLC